MRKFLNAIAKWLDTLRVCVFWYHWLLYMNWLLEQTNLLQMTIWLITNTKHQITTWLSLSQLEIRFYMQSHRDSVIAERENFIK